MSIVLDGKEISEGWLRHVVEQIFNRERMGSTFAIGKLRVIVFRPTEADGLSAICSDINLWRQDMTINQTIDLLLQLGL